MLGTSANRFLILSIAPQDKDDIRKSGKIPCETTLTVTCQNYFPISRIFSGNFAASCLSKLADLSSYSLHISTFSLILKEFDGWRKNLALHGFRCI